jgi:hypothetical protein
VHVKATLRSGAPPVVAATGPITVAVMVSACVTTTVPPSESVTATVTTFAPLPPPQPLNHKHAAAAKLPNVSLSFAIDFVCTLSPTLSPKLRSLTNAF